MRLFVVDAFATLPFSGNPAGVCLLDRTVDDEWMQSVAAELKHSETAFVSPVEDASADYKLRWFTPATEVDLCGHATLAAAHVVASADLRDPVRFATRSGVLTVWRDGDLLVMDFPALPPTGDGVLTGLADALGAEPTWMGRSRFDVIAALDDEASVRELVPDFAALGAIDARGVIVTAPAASTAPYDFVSRFFAPRVGVPEDPATGSAHCVLAPYWAARLRRSEGEPMTGMQLSARGGELRVAVRGDRVELAGRARTVVDGALVA